MTSFISMDLNKAYVSFAWNTDALFGHTLKRKMLWMLIISSAWPCSLLDSKELALRTAKETMIMPCDFSESTSPRILSWICNVQFLHVTYHNLCLSARNHDRMGELLVRKSKQESSIPPRCKDKNFYDVKLVRSTLCSLESNDPTGFLGHSYY